MQVCPPLILPSVLSAVSTRLFCVWTVSSVTWHMFCAVISCFVFGSTVQDFHTSLPPPPTTLHPLPAPSSPYTPLTFPSVGPSVAPPSLSALCSSLNAWLPCGASICPCEPPHQLELCRPEAGCCITTLLVLTAWSFSSV